MLTFASVLAGLALLGSGASAGVSLALYLKYRAKFRATWSILDAHAATLGSLKESVALIDTNHGLLVEAGKTMETSLEALTKRVEVAGTTVELCSVTIDRLQGEVSGFEARINEVEQLTEALDTGLEELFTRADREREEVANAFLSLALQEQARTQQQGGASFQAPPRVVQPQGDTPASVVAARQANDAITTQLAELTRRLSQLPGQQPMPS